MSKSVETAKSGGNGPPSTASCTVISPWLRKSPVPSTLPPGDHNQYALELSVGEAVAAGATRVTFNQPVLLYVENFLDFSCGDPLPIGTGGSDVSVASDYGTYAVAYDTFSRFAEVVLVDAVNGKVIWRQTIHGHDIKVAGPPGSVVRTIRPAAALNFNLFMRCSGRATG